MTRRSLRLCLHKNGIVIAIDKEVLYQKKIPRSLSFRPEFIPGSAPKRNLLCFQGLLPRFFIHKSKHQNFMGLAILNNGRNKPVHLFKVQFHRKPTFVPIIKLPIARAVLLLRNHATQQIAKSFALSENYSHSISEG